MDILLSDSYFKYMENCILKNPPLQRLSDLLTKSLSILSFCIETVSNLPPSNRGGGKFCLGSQQSV